MTDSQGPLGILGGAFDPIHFGHLRCAVEIREQLNLAEVLLVPSANPPHRQAHVAPAMLRESMLQLAIDGLDWCSVDSRELQRDGMSYSVVTLEALRAEYPQRSLCMIVGLDAFLGLPNWHRWNEIPDLAHIIVARRPGSTLPADGPVADLVAQRQTRNPAELSRQPAGLIYLSDITQLDIASSEIRRILRNGNEPRYLLPDAVLQMIQRTKCYDDSKK